MATKKKPQKPRDSSKPLEIPASPVLTGDVVLPKPLQPRERQLGRSTYFTPETRQTIVQTISAGGTDKDACAMAMVATGTFAEWLEIAAAIAQEDWESPYVIDKDLSLPETRLAFTEFAQQVEKARAARRLQSVRTVIRAGGERWVHHLTGAIRTSPPPAITWINMGTGEIVYEPPDGPEYNPATQPAGWLREWSRVAWEYDGGSWQAEAWYLERRYPQDYGRAIHDVNLTLKQEDIQTMSDDELEAIAAGKRPRLRSGGNEG